MIHLIRYRVKLWTSDCDVDFDYIISFSSYEQPIRIFNFYKDFFVYLLFLKGKSFQLGSKYTKIANITVYIKRNKKQFTTPEIGHIEIRVL